MGTCQIPRTPFRCSGSVGWSWIPDCAPSSRARTRPTLWRRPRSRCPTRCLNRSMPGTLPWPMPPVRRASSAPMSVPPRRSPSAPGTRWPAAPGSWSRRTARCCSPGGCRTGRPHPRSGWGRCRICSRRPRSPHAVRPTWSCWRTVATPRSSPTPPATERSARRFGAPGARRDTHPDRPPAQHHAERHVTGSEPESGGERNAESIAARVAEAAASVGAHIVLGAGDQHILDAVARHLPGPLRPVTTIAAGPVPTDSDDRLSARIVRRPGRRSAGEASPAPSGTWLRSSTAGPAACGIDARPRSSSARRAAGRRCVHRGGRPRTARSTARATGSGAVPTDVHRRATPTSAPKVPTERTGLRLRPRCTSDAIVVRLPEPHPARCRQPVAAVLRRG